MKYLLDTNVVSELRKVGDGKADPNVTKWVGAQDSNVLFISAITILEIERGILTIQRRDAAQGSRLRGWMDSRVRPEFAERVLPIDDAIATRCAHLHIPDRRNEADALIAATALVHGLTVVTRNVQDFDGTGVIVVDPWQDFEVRSQLSLSNFDGEGEIF
ncbi:twitching motility protein PilT [Rhizobium sp. R72]|uniref:type II toxin-antitoxin system VapC family toxin n=1 Tax=unclassified Rhizobium TaxID=2613769 RepID=UPI000B536AEA|nr:MULTISPECIES: type II toxin-antitoxin system VapC family toxin [unclassified Rhizobium]OWV92674.1 twitching motility protein PilT [Rhizobium sp. R72]OWV92885.1 twitching motility protein PilT [Rhizobium sp. R711]